MIKFQLFRNIFIAALFLAGTITASASAQQTIDSKAALDNIQKMASLTKDRGENYRKEISNLIDFSLQVLRGPNPSGSGYLFATVSADKNSPAETLLSEKVDAVWESGKQQVYKAETTNVFSFTINSPRYRPGGLFKNNGDTYIDSYKVEYSVNGKEQTISREYKNWVKKNTSFSIPLPSPAEWARIEFTAGVSSSDVNRTVIEIIAQHPVIKDNPKNPYSYPIEQLKVLQNMISYAKPDAIVDKLNDIQDGIRTVPAAVGSGFSADDQTVQKLEYILYLLQGNSADSAKGKSELKSFIETLKTAKTE
ncbi:MAG TPA: hypothetical protein PLQ76_06125 [bacterium]|nr:hypothetical protein [bacterium]